MQVTLSQREAPPAPVLVDGLPAALRLATPDGWIEAGDLDAGDAVLTFEQGACRIADVTRSAQAVQVPPVFWPVILPPGAMGNDHPLELLPAQMIMLESELAEDLHGDPFVMVPALSLTGWNGITRRPPREVEMVHLHFATPQVVFAGPSLLLGCAGSGRAAANLFRGNGMTTLGIREARRLVAALIAQGERAALLASRHAAFAPEARA